MTSSKTPAHSAADMSKEEQDDIRDLHPLLKKKYHILRDEGKTHAEALKEL